MRHLCDKHCRLVQEDGQRAANLWNGAFNHGLAAYQAGDWARAESFLGTAYEIGLVRFASDVRRRQHASSVENFATVGRYYGNVLCRLKDFEAAESCLRKVHDGLLHWSQECYVPYQDRVAAFEQLEEFRHKLIALLRLTGRDTYAKCMDLLAQQLSRQAAQSLYH